MVHGISSVEPELAVFLLWQAGTSEAQNIPLVDIRACQSENESEGTFYFDYPWASEAERSADYRLLEKVYPEALQAVTTALNQTHNLSYAPRHWEITLGSWLGSSLSIVLDRLRILEAAQSAVGQVPILINSRAHRAVADTLDFVRTAAGDDDWNLALMSQITEAFSKSGFTLKESLEREINSPKTGNLKSPPEKTIKRLFSSIQIGLENFFGSILEISGNESPSLVWSAPYFSRRVGWLLRFDLRSVMAIRTFRSKAIQAVPDLTRRNTLRTMFADQNHHGNPFIQSFLALVPWLLPISFLEGFQQKLAAARLQNPVPQAIFSANSHFHDDAFKIWAANAVYSGSALALSEHGGFMKNPECSFGFEARIADQLVTPWKPTNPHESQLPIPRFVGKGQDRKRASGKTLLIVAYEIHRWSIRASAQPQSYRGLDRMNAIAGLLQNLTSPSLDRVIVKKHSKHPLWTEPWKKLDDFALGGLQFSYKPLNTELKRCRLAVCTYPETNYLEALLSGSPVILLCNPQVSGMDSLGHELFEIMQQVGMAFTDSAKAAYFINDHWGSLDQWWHSTDVTQVLEKIPDYIALPQSNSRKEWTAFLGTLGTVTSGSASPATS